MRNTELSRRGLLIAAMSMLIVACMTIAVFAADYSEVYTKYFGNTAVTAPNTINNVFVYVYTDGTEPEPVGLDAKAYNATSSAPDYYCVGFYPTVQRLPWASAAKSVSVTDADDMFTLIGDAELNRTSFSKGEDTYPISNQKFDLRRVTWTKLQWGYGAATALGNVPFGTADAVWHLDGVVNKYKITFEGSDAEQFVTAGESIEFPENPAASAEEHFKAWEATLTSGESMIVEDAREFQMPACDVDFRPIYEAHTWNNGVITKEPTTEDQGEMTYTCGICLAQRTETIDKLPEEITPVDNPEEESHDEVTITEKDNSGNPDTGDDTILTLWLAIFVICSLALGALLVVNRKLMNL